MVSVERNGDFLLFPNPAVNELVVTHPGDGPITVTDSGGRLVSVSCERNGETATLDVHMLSPGTYFITTKNGIGRFLKAPGTLQ